MTPRSKVEYDEGLGLIKYEYGGSGKAGEWLSEVENADQQANAIIEQLATQADAPKSLIYLISLASDTHIARDLMGVVDKLFGKLFLERREQDKKSPIPPLMKIFTSATTTPTFPDQLVGLFEKLNSKSVVKAGSMDEALQVARKLRGLPVESESKPTEE